MKNKINFDIQGIREGKQIKREQTKSVDGLYSSFRGYMIDELQINATINSVGEVEKFINFLYSITPCFNKK
jgi:hypothetical protein